MAAPGPCLVCSGRCGSSSLQPAKFGLYGWDRPSGLGPSSARGPPPVARFLETAWRRIRPTQGDRRGCRARQRWLGWESQKGAIRQGLAEKWSRVVERSPSRPAGDPPDVEAVDHRLREGSDEAVDLPLAICVGGLCGGRASPFKSLWL